MVRILLVGLTLHRTQSCTGLFKPLWLSQVLLFNNLYLLSTCHKTVWLLVPRWALTLLGKSARRCPVSSVAGGLTLHRTQSCTGLFKPLWVSQVLLVGLTLHRTQNCTGLFKTAHSSVGVPSVGGRPHLARSNGGPGGQPIVRSSYTHTDQGADIWTLTIRYKWCQGGFGGIYNRKQYHM